MKSRKLLPCAKGPAWKVTDAWYEDKDPDDLTAMFRIAYDVAVRRCDVCERCGKAPVSKALRIKEPVWGAFDTPSNLLAVCDACYDAGRRELTSD